MTRRLFRIRTPIWKTRSIGLADYALADHNKIVITYKTRDGRLMYPRPFTISKERARQFPLKQFKGCPALRIIPIDEMEAM